MSIVTLSAYAGKHMDACVVCSPIWYGWRDVFHACQELSREYLLGDLNARIEVVKNQKRVHIYRQALDMLGKEG